jgi:hypothetical protein
VEELDRNEREESMKGRGKWDKEMRRGRGEWGKTNEEG